MITRIEVISKVKDTRAQVKKGRLQSLGFKEKIYDIELVDVYTIEKKFSLKNLTEITNVLHNPISQKVFVNSFLPNKFNFALEIGFLPGVTDNVANTTREIIEDLLKIKFSQNEGVYSTQILLIKGKLNKKDMDRIAFSLINPLIQSFHIKSFSLYRKNKGMDQIIPKVNISNKIKVDDINLNISDEELIKLGKMGIENKDKTRRGPLALDLTYMKTIQSYFRKIGRKPTDIELESIAQTWSEHCKHTIFADPIDEIEKGLFKSYIKEATEKIRKKKGKRDFCYSVFTDNSGAIEFDKDYLVTHKTETHNSPSALDPFGGAITGIVGVNRDAIGFGLGAKPIVNTYGFCFANPKNKNKLFKNQKLTEPLLSPKRILEGVVSGVNVGGNCSGIPTPQGFVYFNDRYMGKPLVFVGTVGLIPKNIKRKKSIKKKAQNGDYIVVVGGRVGQDGIHGATFSSEALDSQSPATAVQIGDPITQKKLSDAIVKEARDKNLYNSITDNGAGGLSCSVAEMAKESCGCEVDLEKVPLKYPGLSPWQIWISESQERMTLAVPKNRWREFFKLMEKRGVESTIIGEFNNTGICRVSFEGQTIMETEMNFLHDGLPKRKMQTKAIKEVLKDNYLPKVDIENTLLKMLSLLNNSSFSFISSQYDHEVQGSSVLKPLQGKGGVNSETSVVSPILDSKKAIILSQGLYPTYTEINPYHMVGASMDTAIRNVVAAGGDIEKIAILDNFCWCSSNDPVRLWQLKQAAKACYDFATVFETPFISGKDSMFNDFKGFNNKGKPIKISVPPTLLISSIGVVNDGLKTVSIDPKFPGDIIYLLGETNNEIGGSEFASLLNFKGNSVPKTDAVKNRNLYKKFYKAVLREIISSAIPVNRGGLGIALAKIAIAGQLGIRVSLKKIKGDAKKSEIILFAESTGRILVSVSLKNQKVFEEIMKGELFTKLGSVKNGDEFIVEDKKGKTIINTKISALNKKYKEVFKDF